MMQTGYLWELQYSPYYDAYLLFILYYYLFIFIFRQVESQFCLLLNTKKCKKKWDRHSREGKYFLGWYPLYPTVCMFYSTDFILIVAGDSGEVLVI